LGSRDASCTTSISLTSLSRCHGKNPISEEAFSGSRKKISPHAEEVGLVGCCLWSCAFTNKVSTRAYEHKKEAFSPERWSMWDIKNAFDCLCWGGIAFVPAFDIGLRIETVTFKFLYESKIDKNDKFGKKVVRIWISDKLKLKNMKWRFGLFQGV
jgi:hypothetical protein